MTLEFPEFTVYSLWMILVPIGALACIIMIAGDRLRGTRIEDVDHLAPGRMIVAGLPYLALAALAVFTPVAMGPLFWVGCALSVLALLIYVLAIGAFVKANRGLTTLGVYRLTRNPMYVAILVLLIAVTLMALQAAPVTGLLAAVVSLCIVATTHWSVLIEERFLEGKYGEDYLSYKRKVARYVG